MENFPQTLQKKPEAISIEILPEILEEIKFTARNQPIEDTDFFIEEINYALRFCPSKTDYGEVNGEPAEYFDQENETAIYIWEDLPEKIQRVLLFHEILETYFKKIYKIESTPAHNAVLSYEEEFKKELFLSTEEQKNIQDLRIQ